MKILVCDTDQDNSYNLRDLFAGMKILPEIIEINSVEEAERRIKKGDKFNLLIAGYDFAKNDAYEVIELVKMCWKLGIPSIFLDYPAHRDISKYVSGTTAAVCIYKHEVEFILPNAIKKILRL